MNKYEKAIFEILTNIIFFDKDLLTYDFQLSHQILKDIFLLLLMNKRVFSMS